MMIKWTWLIWFTFTPKFHFENHSNKPRASFMKLQLVANYFMQIIFKHTFTNDLHKFCSQVWKHTARLNFLCNHLLSVYLKCCICTHTHTLSIHQDAGRHWLLNGCNKDRCLSLSLLFLRLHLSLSLWLAGAEGYVWLFLPLMVFDALHVKYRFF